MTPLASLTIGPIQFDTPVWLWLIPIGWGVVLWFGRASLSGLGTVTRQVALGVRLVVILILACAMAEPQWRNQSKSVDVTVVIDASRSIPQHWARDLDQYVEEARRVNPNPQDHRYNTETRCDTQCANVAHRAIRSGCKRLSFQ